MALAIGIGIDLDLTGCPRFDPATLFAGAQAGGWYDPSDLSTMFTDTAGTTPVSADGQSVARINDKSGNGNHLTQATGARQPVYKTSGGKSWLVFIGSKDLHSAVLGSPLAQPNSVAAAVVIDTLASTNGAQNTIFDTISGADHRLYQNLNDMLYIYGSATEVPASSALSIATPYVITALYNGASSFGRVNGSASATGDPGPGDIEQMVMGANGALGNSLFGKIYGLVVRHTAFTAPELAKIETYLGSKCGVVL